jgi:mono/diheme cytochrome c family protein
MKTFLKIIKILFLIIVVTVVGVVTFALTSYKKTFEAPYPNIKASTDSAVIARGKHLALGPAHCADCHAPVTQRAKVDAGEEVALSGGFDFIIPLGTLHTPNITSDPETGIGNLSDGEIARSLRYGIRHDGQAILDLMPFYDLSKEDLTAIISWLRTQPPVKNKIPDNSYTFLGKMIKTFVLAPSGDADVPPAPQPGPTTEYGKYLVNSVANCRGCHTERNLMDGSFVGPELAGGFPFELFGPDGKIIPGKHLVSPNLTPDAGTGIMASWSQEEFIDRFRNGRVIPGSPMPWGPFSRMDDMELIAIYKYLSTLSPISRDTPVGIQEGDPDV